MDKVVVVVAVRLLLPDASLLGKISDKVQLSLSWQSLADVESNRSGAKIRLSWERTIGSSNWRCLETVLIVKWVKIYKSTNIFLIYTFWFNTYLSPILLLSISISFFSDTKFLLSIMLFQYFYFITPKALLSSRTRFRVLLLLWQ